jgi:hypothetical protein
MVNGKRAVSVAAQRVGRVDRPKVAPTYSAAFAPALTVPQLPERPTQLVESYSGSS